MSERMGRVQRWCLIVVLVGVTSCAPSGLGDTDYRTPSGSDVTDYRGGLTRSGVLPGPAVDDPVELWRAPSSAPVTFPPVVVAGEVIAPDAAGVMALDLNSGHRLWTLDLGSVVTSPMTAADHILFAITADRVLHAVSLTTHESLWQVTGAARGAQVSVIDGAAYLGTADHRFMALDARNGSERWSVRIGHSSGKNAIADDIAFIGGDGDGQVSALDLRTHQVLWTLATNTVRVATPSIEGATVYIAGISVGGASGSGDQLLAVDSATGRVQWRFRPSTLQPMASFAVGPEAIYIGADTADGLLYAVDHDTGQRKWEVPNDSAVDRPVIIDETLYVGSGRGGINIYNTKTGQRRAHVDVPGYAEGAIVCSSVILVASRNAPSSPGAVTAFVGRNDRRKAPP